MDAADKASTSSAGTPHPGVDTPATHGGSPAPVRYILTRPCLAEGTLSLLKYLRPLFPEGGAVDLRDSRGEVYRAGIDARRGRLTGLGELYHAHHLGVNDVLLLSREGERYFGVTCVVKPHARPQPQDRTAQERAAHDRNAQAQKAQDRGGQEREAPNRTSGQARTQGKPATREQRVVIHATPHVREVRTERVPAEPRVGEQRTGDHRPAAEPSPNTVPAPAQMAPAQPVPVQALSSSSTDAAPSSPVSRPAPAPVTARAAATAVTARPQPNAVQASTVQPSAVQAGDIPARTTRPSSPQTSPAPARAATTTRPEPQRQEPQSAEERLQALARLTGYTYDTPGNGVVRLRADLGAQSYTVLIATTGAALGTPAWDQPCDYMALLTPESERPHGIPRFTHAALDALLEHARLAPLTPIDLRGYWNTGSFDQDSVESVAELVSAHLAQRGSFSHVLLTLAQQPAHTLVQLPRLAERLGSGVNNAEVQSILDTLSRPPFLALTPLPGGQYYLRSDVRELLQEVGDYAEGLRRRMRKGPAAGD